VVLISKLALAMGMVVAFGIHVLAGRLAGLTATALWSLGNAYFVMPPSYSLRVSSSHDWAALVMYGAAGLVMTKVRPRPARVAHQARQAIPRRPIPSTCAMSSRT
jgi:K+-sensing histidine kinase KdpD